MGGKRSRDKGQRGEREVVQLLQPVIDRVCGHHGVDLIIGRNLNQVRGGGYDLKGEGSELLDWLALEVKRQETLCISQWWDQAVRQAGPEQTPVLLFRQNGKRVWRVVIDGYIMTSGSNVIKVPVEISQANFLYWFQLKLESVLRERADEQVGRGNTG